MAKEAKSIRKITPIGTARYCWLDKPDTKFAQGNDDEGVYKCTLRLDPTVKEHAEFIDFLTKTHEQALSDWKVENPGKARTVKSNPPVKAEVDKETGEETGLLLVATKSKRKPNLFDRKGAPITDPEFKVYGGSKVRLNVGIVPSYMAAYGVGLTCYLNGVQVIEASAGMGGGFDAVPEEEGEMPAEGSEKADPAAAKAAAGLF